MSQTSIPREGAARERRRDNHRATVRYRCAPATSGRLHAGDDQEFQRAWILDVSLSGFGLLLTRPMHAAMPVTIHLRGHQTLAMYEFDARVIHCTPQHGADWLVGCKLAHPLTPEILEDLL